MIISSNIFYSIKSLGRLRKLGFKYKEYWNGMILEVPCSIYTNENNHPGTAIFKKSRYTGNLLFLYIDLS